MGGDAAQKVPQASSQGAGEGGPWIAFEDRGTDDDGMVYFSRGVSQQPGSGLWRPEGGAWVGLGGAVDT